MAKSIWKPGVKITRKEKKALRRLMPHPNRGRRLYQWKVESTRISERLVISGALKGDKHLVFSELGGAIARDKILTMKQEFTYTQFHSSPERNIQAFRPRFTEGFSEADQERFREIRDKIIEEYLVDRIEN